MTSFALTLLALSALLSPCPDGPAMRVLRDAARVTDSSVNPFSQFIEDWRGFDRVVVARTAMRRMNLGMTGDSVIGLFPPGALRLTLGYGHAFRRTSVWRVDRDVTLELDIDTDEGLKSASLLRGKEVIARVGN